MLDDSQRDFVTELTHRRIQGFIDNSGRDYKTVVEPAVAETTTHEDIDKIGSILNSLPEDVRRFIHLYEDVWSEFGKFRCSVCGRTAAQSKAIGYDCIRGC